MPHPGAAPYELRLLLAILRLPVFWSRGLVEGVCLAGLKKSPRSRARRLFAFYSGISIAWPVVASKSTRTAGTKR